MTPLSHEFVAAEHCLRIERAQLTTRTRPVGQGRRLRRRTGRRTDSVVVGSSALEAIR
jgi:hypothetical protein